MFHVTFKTCWIQLSAVTVVHFKHSSIGSWPSLTQQFPLIPVIKRWALGQIPLTAWVCTWTSTGTQPRPFVEILSMAALWATKSEQSSCDGDLRAYKDEKINIWPFTEKVCRALSEHWRLKLVMWHIKPFTVPRATSPISPSNIQALSHWTMHVLLPKNAELLYMPFSFHIRHLYLLDTV